MSELDVFDYFAFVVMGVLFAAVVIIIVVIGGLPGRIATLRNHPQAAAIKAAGWISLITLGAAVAHRFCVGVYPAASSSPGERRRGRFVIAFISIIYIAAVVLVFKVFKVKPGPWSIALMATIGFVLLGGIIILWTVAAPFHPKPWSDGTSLNWFPTSRARSSVFQPNQMSR